MVDGFRANEVHISEEDWGLLVVLAAPPTEDRDFYLMLQRARDFSESDRKLGQDKPYIEFCGQGWSWYGHILSFCLSPASVVVQLDESAAKEMRGDGLIEIGFDLEKKSFENFQAALRRVFEGFDYYQEA